MSVFQINPSILSADLARLGEDVKAVLDAGADNVHFDVMDNHYVPNLTFGPMVLKALRDYGITAGMDVHLMVKPVDSMIESFAKAGASSIVFHPEASEHVDRSLQLIKSYDIQAGLALNPATSLECLKYVEKHIDRVLLMSVNPGFGGQKFIPEMLDKAKEVSSWIESTGRNITLEIDGGVNPQNIVEIAKCGVNAFVAGSAIFNSDSYKNTISKMREELANI
ncbi:ribulose-phosphate 3-epimerase [Francisella adeliensis]|uniref:Ribulose-phosphate 3-epimerase n=1 Tax=Francisella adeliensis TaxID=2007306 RepID=A0A2Z4XXT2_9GAMM|nr:ribulose-phosphate 3-epimerase [Francisella adeliensis]AXA33691.1 ribulose-phosphate 3-epimerase [Francisella adeliensis]MBK2085584.1 ribulose-phosphate 3-epimerase [Francisella adeliensis]MBK2097462.1 ribulose-phosphate 3-epimerase [Francisella adeliensis]QIW11925.1 ribulose-phosphate 3-epimerase [Francisella adeliensis]QIW13801.1 ribulose-phosphate 3-epimerase [Francisella adeliensis]